MSITIERRQLDTIALFDISIAAKRISHFYFHQENFINLILSRQIEFRIQFLKDCISISKIETLQRIEKKIKSESSN